MRPVAQEILLQHAVHGEIAELEAESQVGDEAGIEGLIDPVGTFDLLQDTLVTGAQTKHQ